MCECVSVGGGEVHGFLTPPGDIKDLSSSMVDRLAGRPVFHK